MRRMWLKKSTRAISRFIRLQIKQHATLFCGVYPRRLFTRSTPLDLKFPSCLDLRLGCRCRNGAIPQYVQLLWISLKNWASLRLQDKFRSRAARLYCAKMSLRAASPSGSRIVSFLKHPQLFVLPLTRLLVMTFRVCPHEHLQSHRTSWCLRSGVLATTVRRPKVFSTRSLMVGVSKRRYLLSTTYVM